MTFEQILEGLQIIRYSPRFVNQPRIEVRICEKDWVKYMGILWKSTQHLIVVEPPAAWTTCKEMVFEYIGIKCRFVHTPLEEYDGTTYILPHFYVSEDKPLADNPLPIGLFAWVGDKFTQFPDNKNDKLLLNIRKNLNI